MMLVRFVVNFIINAFIFAYVLPVIDGIHFQGSFFPEAVVYALFFTVVAWVVFYLVLASVVLTLGISCLFILFGFWLLPAIELKLVAWLFPAHFAIDGWWPAILGGLILMIVHIICSFLLRSQSSK